LGVRVTTVPYKGTGPALIDLLGGQVDILCDQTTQTIQYIKENRVKVYGVTTPKRLSSLPNVPTLDEQGMKGFDVKVWHGVYAPLGTPKPVLDKINIALKKALADPDIKTRLDTSNIDIVPVAKQNGPALQVHLDAEINRWGPIIRKANIPD
jgi:tripartite-type tricarboxylate transporter receptor subunit TctC